MREESKKGARKGERKRLVREPVSQSHGASIAGVVVDAQEKGSLMAAVGLACNSAARAGEFAKFFMLIEGGASAIAGAALALSSGGELIASLPPHFEDSPHRIRR